MSLTVTNVQCPVCAGVVQFQANRKICHCLYCSTQLLLPEVKHCPRYLVPSKLDREQVDRKVKETLSGGRVASNFIENCKPDSLRLLFIALYEVKGTSFVTVEQEDKKGEKDTVVNLRDIVYYDFAIADKQLGLANIDMASFLGGGQFSEAIAFDVNEIPEGAQVFTPDKTPEQVKAMFTQRGVGKQLKRGVCSELFGSTITQYCYPIWIIRYPFNGSYYRFVVDGVKGTIIKGRAPENRAWSSLLAQFFLLISAFISYGLVYFLSDTGVYRQLTLFGTLVTLVFSLLPLSLLHGIWLRLWFGRDIAIKNDELHLQPIYHRDTGILEGMVDTAEELACFIAATVYGGGERAK